MKARIGIIPEKVLRQRLIEIAKGSGNHTPTSQGYGFHPSMRRVRR